MSVYKASCASRGVGAGSVIDRIVFSVSEVWAICERIRSLTMTVSVIFNWPRYLDKLGG